MMKSLITTCICLLFLGIGSLQAQIDVTINPIGILWGDINLGADFGIKEDFSIEGLIGFGTGNELDADFNSFNVTSSAKYYFNPKNGVDKFYGFGFLRFVNRSYDYEDDSVFANYSQSRLGLGVGAGFKAASDKGFIFDINLGVGRAIIDNTSFDDGNGEEVVLDWPDIMFTGKIGVGYRFNN
ncbi:MAG: hypothetical protein Sapg2KO_52610 [Saprospiraceae bacterium]